MRRIYDILLRLKHCSLISPSSESFGLGQSRAWHIQSRLGTHPSKAALRRRGTFLGVVHRDLDLAIFLEIQIGLFLLLNTNFKENFHIILPYPPKASSDFGSCFAVCQPNHKVSHNSCALPRPIQNTIKYM